ncbi:MAG TPA: 50S ribosomal protein L18 [Chitinispirillaceae bacterium]|jgi:large subunit ribosomal protein L18|nr:50S ribosomal protein L18 [Chitinispirillaceae bacterium]
MNNSERRLIERKRRAERVRKSITGTPERPRLCVRRSLNHIYAQIIDDVNRRTLIEVGSRGRDFAQKIAGKKVTKTEISKMIGEMLAEQAKEKGVTSVVFDRKGYLFHGRVKALAEAARSKGLAF